MVHLMSNYLTHHREIVDYLATHNIDTIIFGKEDNQYIQTSSFLLCQSSKFLLQILEMSNYKFISKLSSPITIYLKDFNINIIELFINYITTGISYCSNYEEMNQFESLIKLLKVGKPHIEQKDQNEDIKDGKDYDNSMELEMELEDEINNEIQNPDVINDYEAIDDDTNNDDDPLGNKQDLKMLQETLNKPENITENDFQVGTLFSSFEEFKIKFKTFTDQRYYITCIHESRRNNKDNANKDRFPYEEYCRVCCHYGKPRETKSKVEISKRRKVISNKLECPFGVRIRYQNKLNLYKVTHFNEHHKNHEISKTAFYKTPSNRRLNHDEIQKYFVEYHEKLKLKPKVIVELIKNDLGKEISIQDLHNIKFKFSRLKLRDQSNNKIKY